MALPRLSPGASVRLPWPTFPQAPLFIPDGRISRVRLATLATVRNDAFPLPPRLKCQPTYTPGATGLRHRSTSLRTTELVGSVSLSGTHHDVHQAPRAPLPPSGVTWRGVAHRLPRRALPLFRCSYGLMRQTKPLPPARFPLPMGLCRLLPVPAGRWPFPTLSLRVFPWMPGPVPRRLVEMLSPVTSLHDIGLPPVGPGSALEKVRSATSERR